MTLHYSAQFENFPIPVHGEVDFPLDTYQVGETYIKPMNAFCRKALYQAIEGMKFETKHLLKVEYYFYRNNEEVVFFKWEREGKIKENQI